MPDVSTIFIIRRHKWHPKELISHWNLPALSYSCIVTAAFQKSPRSRFLYVWYDQISPLFPFWKEVCPLFWVLLFSTREHPFMLSAWILSPFIFPFYGNVYFPPSFVFIAFFSLYGKMIAICAFWVDELAYVKTYKHRQTFDFAEKKHTKAFLCCSLAQHYFHS